MRVLAGTYDGRVLLHRGEQANLIDRLLALLLLSRRGRMGVDIGEVSEWGKQPRECQTKKIKMRCGELNETNVEQKAPRGMERVRAGASAASHLGEVPDVCFLESVDLVVGEATDAVAATTEREEKRAEVTERLSSFTRVVVDSWYEGGGRTKKVNQCFPP